MTTIPDFLAVLGLLVPAGAGLAGYGLAGRNERARDERAAEREGIARRASVRERLEEQGHAFQRETLLELQDALQRMVRCAAQIILHDQDALKQDRERPQLGEKLNNETYEVGVTTRRLQERILDTALREAVGQFRKHMADTETCFAVAWGMKAEEGITYLEGQLREVTMHYMELSELVGVALRTELGWLPEDG